MQNHANKYHSAGDAFGDVGIADAIAMAAERPPLRDGDRAIIGADFSDAPADVQAMIFGEAPSAVDLDGDYAEADDAAYADFLDGMNGRTAERARRHRLREALRGVLGDELTGAEIIITIKL
jgi:hypothetical protein